MEQSNAQFGLDSIDQAAADEALRGMTTHSENRDAGIGGAMDSHGFPKKYHKILIFKGNQKHDLSYVPVSIGGYAWKLERGVQLIVPSVITEVLNNAVQDITSQSNDGLVTRPAHRFPFQIVGEATEQEYLDFKAKNTRVDTRQAA